MKKKQLFYRGYLKSCNYSCHYCPFSKHISLRELKKDKEYLERFISFLEHQTIGAGAVLFVPYGEALIHEYYWKAMARLSKLSEIEAVGCQTNLSFPVLPRKELFEQEGGQAEKLRLWCTFHPTMTSKEKFLEQCNLLEKAGIAYCVGAVGVPQQQTLLQELRCELPKSVYLWINPMDGLERNYTKEEIEKFSLIDPFFPYQLKHKPSNPIKCHGCRGDAFFVQANGDITSCNISKKKIGNLYDSDIEKITFDFSHCGQKECSCFLSYCNRMDFEELAFYGKYPAFRMAKIPKAIFLDIDGTLVKEGAETIEPDIIQQIADWSKHSDIYVATSLPFVYAIKKCGSIKKYLSGGVFANGAMCSLFQQQKRWFVPIEQDFTQFLEQMQSKYAMKVKIYQIDNKIYKITCKGKYASMAEKILREQYIPNSSLTVLVEGDYLQITGQKADKANGILKIMEYCGYQKEDIFTVGNSENDRGMIEEFRGIFCGTRDIFS